MGCGAHLDPIRFAAIKDTGTQEKALKPIQRGFTLIELMIAVAIVAIIAAVAYPSYTKQVQKSNRRAAQAEMLEIANREQQFLMANRSYATKAQLTTAGYTLPSTLSNLYTWDVALGAGSVPTFTITFTATGPQADDGALTYTHDGVKGPAEKW